ncbi:MAG: GTP cyclohydrolase II [Rhodospirillaceae bacterium]|jgi:GTP cyclohydrolase II|nr:GTP cyclohydrolase II [Rhodospirillaceae bacterium]MBT5240912.1 GTP cyclohydrolase II [Rhodospirillaceae bacterium]MBT5564987.1 GTP cyclohydrolase II [Rhodospirillaceae bacterium]MBT6090249.1 GTP cyclohydrolase II [Rhodospirillaceae bacterium]MBT7450743.1 GTP cyclohydrolase II [Rhodospirillaceae bacterium]
MNVEAQTESDVEVIAVLETVDRAVAELRRGSAVVVISDGEAVLARPAETVDARPLPYFNRQDLDEITVAVTGRRAAILGLAEPAAPAVILRQQDGFSPNSIRTLIDPKADAQGPVPPLGVTGKMVGDGSAAYIAVRLTKIARLLPAVVVATITANDPVAWANANGRTVVSAAAVRAYDRLQADTLVPVSEATVPLAGCENTKIIAFRPRDGGVEHLAIVIGEPDTNGPVLARLHSECFTGDLLGSLKCDCGDQLRGAITAIAEDGGGVLLYLAQEGRGIGLVNKLRAYELQEKGFDTVDANEQLGFDDDERIYLPAVQMLTHLGIDQVKLLTNNPAKVGALARHGVAVTERVAHVFPSNQHNWSYLDTKAKRSGHLF